MKLRMTMRIDTANLVLTIKLAVLGTLSTLAVLSSETATAQSLESVQPGVIDRPIIQPPAAIKRPTPVPSKPEPLLETVPVPGEPVATIKQFVFKGDLVLSESALQRVVAPYLDRALNRGDVAQLKYELTKYFYAKGYVFVKVTTPPQDLSDGSMEIVIYQGRIGDIRIDLKDDTLNRRIAEAFAWSLNQGDVFREQTAETVLKDINDIPNLTSALRLRPGKELGTTDLTLYIDKTREDRQVFTLDNYGSKFTGRPVARLHLEKSNLFRNGETLSVDLAKSFGGDDKKDQRSINLKAVFPVGFQNWKTELNYYKAKNEIGDFLAPLDIEGESSVWQVAFSKNLWNQVQRTGTVRFGVDSGRYESEQIAGNTKDTITHAFVETSFLRRRARWIYYSNLRVSKGIGWFGASDKGPAPPRTRPFGEPRAWIVDALVYLNFKLSDSDFLQVSGQGQWADEILLASDLFAIGGYGSVRGFNLSQETGERGVSGTVEWNHYFRPHEKWQFQVGAWGDYGTVDNKADFAGTLDNPLASVGVMLEAKYGYKARFSSYEFPKRFATTLRLDWAFPVGDYQDLSNVSDNFLYFRLIQTF